MNTDTLPIPKHYDFKSTEERLYHWWDESGYFKPHNQPQNPDFDPEQPTYVISIPPPNVTGKLHLGHAMFVSMEDLMIRYHRMRGYSTLWVPGSDHAGIATQLQVEKALQANGTTRQKIGRAAFLKHAWDWKNRFGGIITQQLRRLGASCDWERERFTLDEGPSRAVREAFVRLYQQGMIYRGPRMINWSPGLMTAVSDLEVEYTEEQGKLYYFKYNIKDSQNYIPVATTRPETILGDTAVAVHPEDNRYTHLVNRTVLVPILGREIPVIADDTVDPNFGSGALKITPGHDQHDYEIGIRHNLPLISVLDKTATVTSQGGPYEGLDRFEAREKLWHDMRASNLAIKEEPYTLNVPRSQRGGEIIEPLVSTQWFVKTKPLAEAALLAVRDGRIKIVPQRFEKVYFNWLENVRDWCISRQLWWGHRIPVWYAPDGTQFCARSEDEAYAIARRSLGDSVTLKQDPDVLDTWFSSGLWPFSTLGWPERTPDMRYFYPTSMLETGYDILFFWVARMIMMGLHFTGEVPFRQVYLHGLVRDEQGRKMSKTTGNVIDPIQVMDEYGADALRFTLLTGSSPGNDTNLSIERVKATRNFANKIWNAARYVIGQLGSLNANAPVEPSTLADRWILGRLAETVDSCTRLIDNHQYGQAGTLAYEFFWSDYADWYIEISKQQLAQRETALTTARTLVTVLDTTLRLLHPYVPFLTEEIWQLLKNAAGERFVPPLGWPRALIIAEWPATSHSDTDSTADDSRNFAHLMAIVRAIRNIRSKHGVDTKRFIRSTFIAGAQAPLLDSQRTVLATLARLDPDQLTIAATHLDQPDASIALVVGTTEIYLPLQGMLDINAERTRLEKELASIDTQIVRLRSLLQSPFSEKAPGPVVDAERKKLGEHEASREKLTERLSGLSNSHQTSTHD